MINLKQYVKRFPQFNPTVAGVTTLTGTGKDISGFRGCRGVAKLGTVSAGQTSTIKLKQCDTVDGSYEAIADASYSIQDGDSNKWIEVECAKPTKKFVQMVIARSGGNVVLDSGCLEAYEPLEGNFEQEDEVESADVAI
jgi:hypothetical protein